MKKIITTRIFTILGALLFAVPVFAATTVSLSPSPINVTAGQTFNVVVTVSPSGTKDFAEKVQLQFPAGILKVNSFTPASSWMALTTSGYDAIDNTNGTIVKSGGYPSGISSATAFGTISFTALKAGSGSITVGSQSSAFVTSGQSAITGSGTAFVVASPTVIPVKTTVTPKAVAVVSPVLVAQVATSTATATVATTQTNTNSQTAAAAEAGSPSYTWLWILLIVVALALIGWGIYSRRANKKL